MNINAIIAQFDLQTQWFLNALNNCSESDCNRPWVDNMNPIKWIAGHITDARMTIHALVSGDAINEQYKKLFGKGTHFQMSDSVPTMEQIKADWQRASEQLIKTLQHVPEEKLLSQAPFQTSIPDQTLLGLVAYFVIHETYHIGQISIYNKLLENK